VTRVVLSEEAEVDALTAFRFYEGRREGLGERFRDHVGIALGRIQASPELSPIIYRALRRRLVERFPYASTVSIRDSCTSSRSCMPSRIRRYGNDAHLAASLANKPLKHL
jgi:hypothetical protein